MATMRFLRIFRQTSSSYDELLVLINLPFWILASLIALILYRLHTLDQFCQTIIIMHTHFLHVLFSPIFSELWFFSLMRSRKLLWVIKIIHSERVVVLLLFGWRRKLIKHRTLRNSSLLLLLLHREAIGLCSLYLATVIHISINLAHHRNHGSTLVFEAVALSSDG